MPASRYPYVQSRLQARHGRRPRESDWRLLEANRYQLGIWQYRDW